jgi:ankyrin repeat protein
MDPRFHPAVAAVKAGDLERFRALLREDPSLATARSSKSHPTLLQCVVLDGFGVPQSIEMARLLLDRGATIHNLRIAAGLGRAALLDGFFHPDSSLTAQAGTLAWPFGEPTEGWSRDPQDIIDNAFVYACRSGQIAAVERLLAHGARINAIPPGFDYAGTGLHYAAMDGHRLLVEHLLAHGADPRITSRKVRGTIHHTDTTAAGWADHGGHPAIKELLERAEHGE